MNMERGGFNPEETEQAKKFARKEEGRGAAHREELLRSPNLKLDKETILSIIAEGASDFVFHKLSECRNLDSDIFVTLATAAPDRIDDLTKNIEKFSHLDDRAANVLMDQGMSSLVLEHRESFNNVSQSLWKHIEQVNDPFYDPNEEYVFEDIKQEQVWTDKVNASDNPKNLFLSAIANGDIHYVTNYLNNQNNVLKDYSFESSSWGEEVRTTKTQHLTGFDKEVALALIKYDLAGEVLRHIEKFSGIDKEVAEALARGYGFNPWTLLDKMEYFGEPIPAVLDQCLKSISTTTDALQKANRGSSWQRKEETSAEFYDKAKALFGQNNLLKFKEIDPGYLKKFTKILSQAHELGFDFAEEFLGQFSVFKNLKRDSWQEMFSLASQWGASGLDIGLSQQDFWNELLSHQASFTEPTPAEMAQDVRARMGNNFLIDHFHLFKELPRELGQELVRHKLNELKKLIAEKSKDKSLVGPPRNHDIHPWGYNFVVDDYGEYDDEEPVQQTQQDIFRQEFSDIIQRCRKITKFFGEDVDRAFYRVLEEWGAQENFLDLYDAYNQLLNGKIPEQIKKYGVTKTGEAGIQELRASIKIRLDTVLWKGDPVAIREAVRRGDPFIFSAVKKAVRLNEAEWGKTSEEAMIFTFQEYLERKEKIQPLREVYKPSEILFIKKIDKEKETENSITFTEDFVSRYTQIIESLRTAQRLLPTTEGLNQILDRIKEKIKKIHIELTAKITSLENEKARNAIQGNLAKLEQVLNGSMNPQEQFNVLRTFKGEFDEELREMMFFLGFHFNPTYAEKDLAAFNTEHPSLEELSWTLNFVDHIVNKETLSKYFTDKKAAQNFRGLLNVTALEDGLKQFQDEPTKGTTPFKFVPDRGILTEFSGHISDACWASKYPSILEEFPNFTSLIMVQNPDNTFERIAGAAFLIEAESDQGEKLLIIRGLNPQENIINQLSVKDFYQQLTQYLKPLAQSDGRQLAIVIDGHSGGAATNRPLLFAHLDQIKRGLRPVKLNPAVPTQFNEYKLDGKCYFVD